MRWAKMHLFYVTQEGFFVCKRMEHTVRSHMA